MYSHRPYAPPTSAPSAISARRVPTTIIAIFPPVHLDGALGVAGAACAGGRSGAGRGGRSGSDVGSVAGGSAMTTDRLPPAYRCAIGDGP